MSDIALSAVAATAVQAVRPANTAVPATPAQTAPEQTPPVVFDFGGEPEVTEADLGVYAAPLPGQGEAPAEAPAPGSPGSSLDKAKAIAAEDPAAVIRRLALLATAHEMFSTAQAEGRATGGATLDIAV